MLYWLAKAVLYPVLLALFRPSVRGLEHVPVTGPAILASNHLSFSDSVFLPLVVPRRMSFMAKAEYFTGRGLKGRLTAGFFKGIGQLPVDRSGGKAGEAAILLAEDVLQRGELFGIYPEGTRSPDGRLYRGKTGVARVALRTGVPVLPVAMFGTDVVQPAGRRIPRIRRVGVVIGPPMDFSRYEGLEADRFVLRAVTDEIVYEMMRLSGQEYVDLYASTMKERLSSASRKDRPSLAAARAGRGAPGGRPAPGPAAPAQGAPPAGTLRTEPGAPVEPAAAAVAGTPAGGEPTAAPVPGPEELGDVGDAPGEDGAAPALGAPLGRRAGEGAEDVGAPR